jgi:hypothetical protein
MKIKTLLMSLIFHIGLSLLFYSTLPDKASEPSDAYELTVETVKVNRPAQAALEKKLQGKAPSRATGTHFGGSRKALFPEYKLGFNAAATERVVAKANKPYYSYSDSRNYYTDISEVFGEDGNENWSFFKEVYFKVDSNLSFDSLLAQYNHFGRVYVQFKLDENGVLLAENLKVQARDSILKVHVLRAIKKSFSEPMNVLNHQKGDSGLLFQARFDFNLGEYQNNFYKQKNFGRPVFSFTRFTEEKPVPENLLEQLLTGGVSPNVSLMYERWQKYNQKHRRSAVQFDPFESYRRDPFYKL